MDNLLLNEMMRRANQNRLPVGPPQVQMPPIILQPRMNPNIDPRLIGPFISSMSPGDAMAMMNRGSGYRGVVNNEHATEAGGASPVYPTRPQTPVGMSRPIGSMPTPVGMNRPTFSSWLNQQRAGDGRATVQQRIGEMRNRAGGNSGQIPGDATGMGYNFVGGGPARQIPGDATGMGNNAMSRGVMRNTFQDRAEQMRNGGGYR